MKLANLDNKYAIDDRVRAFENHERGVLVSLAGPGTGKTYSFLQRIRALIEKGDDDPSSITYLTFIKEITSAFVSDYEEVFQVRVDKANGPRISTLHSFACRLIRNRGFTIGYDGPLYFISFAQTGEMRSKVFIEDMLPFVDCPNLVTPAQLRNALEKIKVEWRDDKDPSNLEDPFPDVFSTCLDLSRSYRVMDWDQTVPTAHSLFLDPNNRQDWILRINHYLIDEFQDFNSAEQHFISLLAENVKSMVIVGDDNQSIYSSRGGSPQGLRELSESDGVDTITLLRCRRCKSFILERSNTFLNILRPEAQPLLPYYDGGEARCFHFKSSTAELSFLVDFLQSCINRLPDDPGTKDGIVCLFPTKKALGFYFDSLKDTVPCYIRGVQESERRNWVSLILELVCHPNQRFIERLILQTFSDVKPRHRKAMVRLIIEKDITPVEAINCLLVEGQITGKAKQSAVAFINLCQSLSSQEPEAISEMISKNLDLETDDLAMQLSNFIAAINEIDQDEAIGNFCDSILPETALPPEDPRAILFLTMHGSKGLTKNTVVMPGLEDAWLPGESRGEDLQEKARLFYVALSRATNLV